MLIMSTFFKEKISTHALLKNLAGGVNSDELN